MKELTTRCCIVGGGPAGMMLGFLLARAGIDITVLEKHGDFLRDFRGDTVHPSTLELMNWGSSKIFCVSHISNLKEWQFKSVKRWFGLATSATCLHTQSSSHSCLSGIF